MHSGTARNSVWASGLSVCTDLCLLGKHLAVQRQSSLAAVTACALVVASASRLLLDFSLFLAAGFEVYAPSELDDRVYICTSY